MLASEATRCTPEEWGNHPGNPRRGLPRIMVYGARGHASGSPRGLATSGPRQSTLLSPEPEASCWDRESLSRAFRYGASGCEAGANQASLELEKSLKFSD